jgi:hypothetical protein
LDKVDFKLAWNCFHSWLDLWVLIYNYNFLNTVFMRFYRSMLGPGIPISANILLSTHFLNLFFYCCTGSTLWHSQKFLQYSMVEFTNSIMLLYPSCPHSWNSFSRSHFSTYIPEHVIFPPYSSSYFVSLIFTLLHPFLISFPLPLVSTFNPTGPALPSWFYFAKKWHFCLFKIAIQEVSLWYFHVYMYYNPNWFIPSIFLLSMLIPFLWWF